MSVDFTGRWAADLKSNPILPGIEAGMVVFKIDHVEPLLQLTVVTSAPRYALGHFVCNYRTDGTDVMTSVHSLQVRTNAHWESDQLLVEMHMEMGKYRRRIEARCQLSKDGRVLTVEQHGVAAAAHLLVLERQNPPED